MSALATSSLSESSLAYTSARAALAELATAAELANASYSTDGAPVPSATVERPFTRAKKPTTVTESVTDSVAPKTRPVTRHDVIDMDTAQIERGKDFEAQGMYRVLAGGSILLGYLGRDRRRRWEARTAATALTVPGGPWRDRQDALIGLSLNGGIRTTETRKPPTLTARSLTSPDSATQLTVRQCADWVCDTLLIQQ